MSIHNPMPDEQGHEPLPDIDLRKLFEGAKRSLPPEGLPTVVNAGGVFFLTLSADDRAGIATTIERLINMLDALDADPDLEEGGDLEPNIGWASGDRPARGFIDCREREADESDCEPSLGSSNDLDGGFNQSRWAHGSTDDREEENEHGGDINDEPHDDNELEPFLGWSERYGQGEAGMGLYDFDANDDGDGGLDFDGEGGRQAREALRHVTPRQKPNLRYAEMAHKLPDGTIMRTFVTDRDGRVAPC